MFWHNKNAILWKIISKIHLCRNPNVNFKINKKNYLFFSHDVIPIVMGARPEDYAISAPYKSYIHVDDFDGPKELADFLHKLYLDDQLYNDYFKWKVSVYDSSISKMT